MFKILTINPGSTSTKIGVFHDEQRVFEKSIPFVEAESTRFKNVVDQLGSRFDAISHALKEAGIEIDGFDAVVGRGGLLAPIPSGTYEVSDEMEDYLRQAPRGEHASNLGAFLARRFASLSACLACIVDPVSVDELADVARVSGAPEIERVSLVHALNQKAVARKVAKKLGKPYESCRFIVAHLGSGATIGAHIGGKIVDVLGAKQDGPMSAERAGGLPVDGLIQLCFSGRYTKAELERKMLSGWGFLAYLGTRDLRGVMEKSKTDAKAALVLDAFIYQVAKGIGELSTVLEGEIDAIILTGGMTYSEDLNERILKRTAFLAPIHIIPGEDELEALAEGALRVLNGTEKLREYRSEKSA
ncbi:butyrate kinase [Synergistaceae bacterium OttesenSCG-928-D05]|nr:butyrate kinase [Synergistaceae bacterium OttesenSCG-928-D05]